MKRMVVSNEYNYKPEMRNIKGLATEINSYGNVMFYRGVLFLNRQ